MLKITAPAGGAIKRTPAAYGKSGMTAAYTSISAQWGCSAKRWPPRAWHHLRWLRDGIADPVDLVEHAQARHLGRPDFPDHFLGHLDLALVPGVAGVDHVEQQRCGVTLTSLNIRRRLYLRGRAQIARPMQPIRP